MQVSVRDLMASQPATIQQHTSLAEATRTILERALPEVYVTDDSGRLLGKVSDYELLKASLMKCDTAQPVTRIMSRNLLVLRPDTPYDEIAGLFRESCHSRLPVVENGHVVGQLCRRDVLRTLLVLEEFARDDRENAEAADCLRVEGAETVSPPSAHLAAEATAPSVISVART